MELICHPARYRNTGVSKNIRLIIKKLNLDSFFVAKKKKEFQDMIRAIGKKYHFSVQIF
jgi:hypothetical protein